MPILEREAESSVSLVNDVRNNGDDPILTSAAEYPNQACFLTMRRPSHILPGSCSFAGAVRGH